ACARDAARAVAGARRARRRRAHRKSGLARPRIGGRDAHFGDGAARAHGDAPRIARDPRQDERQVVEQHVRACGCEPRRRRHPHQAGAGTMTLQAPAAEQKDVLFRNVAELQQREKARELGAGLVLQLYRLGRVTQFHAVDNMAVLQQTEQTLEAIRLFAQQTTERPAILFSRGTVFVAGQLLKATRSEYEAALELGAMLDKLGLNQIAIDKDAGVEDIHALVRAIRTPPRDDVSPEPVVRPSPHVLLSRVSSALFGADDDTLSEDEQVVRAYATSV